MSDYVVTTDFSVKDGLTSGDPNKLIKGSDFDTEFDAIAVATATKYDSNDIASSAEAIAELTNLKILTPLRLANWADGNGGMVGELQELTDPGADRIFFWDDGEAADSNVAFLTVGDGLEISTTTLQLPATLSGAGLTLTSGVLAVGGGNGITANADDVALTDVTAAAGQPVNISSGTFTFDMSALDTLNIETVSQSGDSILISDAGTLKLLPIDSIGSKIVAASTKTVDADDEVNVIYVNTGASNFTMTIQAEATKDFPIGTEIGFLTQSTGTITLAITSDTIVSLNSNLTVKASGGGAYLVKTGNATWSLMGDLE
jgi:hypothetical protein